MVSSDQQSITIRTLASPQESHTSLVKNEIDTMEKVLRFTTKKYPDKKCLGTRQILADEDEEQPDGRMFKKVKHFSRSIFTYFAVESLSYGWTGVLPLLLIHFEALPEVLVDW